MRLTTGTDLAVDAAKPEVAPRARWLRAALQVTLVAIVAAALLPSTTVDAQEPPLLSHTYAYAETATFRLSLVEQPEVARATLLLQVNGVSTDGQTVPVEAGSASLTLDLTRAPFPPFARVTYWWVYEAGDSQWSETEKLTFRYVDNRYSWRSVAADDVTVHWIDGDPDVMAQALAVAADTLQAINAALKAPMGNQNEIYVYPSETDLASALQLGGQTWVSGIAYPQLGVILVAVPPNSGALSAVQRDIPHELSHKALYDLLGKQGYTSLPTWLNEGLATFFEASPDPTYARVLTQGAADNSLIPVAELCAPFPEDPSHARLAYAQSGSLVQYIRLQYGWSRIRDLLTAYADGQACSTGAQKALGIDLAQLERDWLHWLSEDETTQAPVSALNSSAGLVAQDIGPWALLLGALLLSPVLMLAGSLRR